VFCCLILIRPFGVTAPFHGLGTLHWCSLAFRALCNTSWLGNVAGIAANTLLIPNSPLLLSFVVLMHSIYALELESCCFTSWLVTVAALDASNDLGIDHCC
jgi:hypothetical protein